ncbi:hypothetical protein CJ030_MR5G009656 [Morella rubra]|uniref:ASCH domain-containing protein n=1 Tax=Morella rubra TaxID=262757 RepID=A0A6A1VK18_9ROSI|nr:hypothetical protein CJ030_MR5G009656 [Morella rubra]
MSPVNLRECMEELVRFTLESYLNETLECDLGISKAFCSNLLKEDPNDPNSTSADSYSGVPPYPFYKRLASSLLESIDSKTYVWLRCNSKLIPEGSSFKHKENEWQKLVLDKGSEIVNIIKTTTHELHVQEPFFSQLKDGRKTIEGRCAVGEYNRIVAGSLILFNKCVLFDVQDVHRYASFSDMLRAESLAKVLPGVETIEEVGDNVKNHSFVLHNNSGTSDNDSRNYSENSNNSTDRNGVQIYRKIYTEEKEKSNGVLAIYVSKVDIQPYICLATLLSGLSYGGVQGLLGMTNTIGTIPVALTPARSTLLSSFMLPYKPNVEGCTLTHGARELAKHANRCSSKYWGTLKGSDSDKNKLAMDVICHLIADCDWLNVHVVPPHGAVFEIRVADGYGARWSNDGSEFIGFLEPYMEDGHSKGWRH